MFTRKDTKVNATIFDVSGFSEGKKKELFDKVLDLNKEGITSLSDSSKSTHLFIPSVFNSHSSNLWAYNSTVDHCLFHDLLGTEEEIKRAENDIIDYTETVRNKSFKLITKHDTVIVDGDNLKGLLEKHHPKEIKNIGKRIEVINRDQSIRNKVVLHYPYALDNVIVAPITFEEIDRVIIIDTVYTASEIQIVATQSKDLLNILERECIALRNSNSLGKLNMENIKEFFTNKVKLSDKSVWARTDEALKEDILYPSNFHKYAFNSLFDENDIPMKGDNSCVFIPVTYVLFLAKSSNIFPEADKILCNNLTIKAPRFFVSTVSFSMRTMESKYPARGANNKQPNFYKYCSRILPDITTNDNALNVKLTSIPKQLSERLLKSNLKALHDHKLTTQEYEGVKYTVPKSLLDEDLMSSFVFYSVEKEKEIREPNVYNDYFSIRFDGNINLSYFTVYLQKWLVNRFGFSLYENNRITEEDLLGNGKMLQINKPDIKKCMQELQDKHYALSLKFNHSTMIITREMFAYEAALLLFLQLIRSMKNTYFFKYYKSQWNDSFEFEVMKGLDRNNYKFTPRIIKKIRETSLINFTIPSNTKATILELLFEKIMNNTKEDVLKNFDSLVAEINETIDKEMEIFIKVYRIPELVLSILNKNPSYNCRNVFNNAYFRKVPNPLSDKKLIYSALLKERSDTLIVLMMIDSYMSNFTNAIYHLYDTVLSLLRIYEETFYRPLRGDEIKENSFLTDGDVRKKLISYYNNWCTRDAERATFICDFLESNGKSKEKITKIDDFIRIIFDKYIEYYKSNQKIDVT